MLNGTLNYLGYQYKKRFHKMLFLIEFSPKKGITKRRIPLIFGFSINNPITNI